MGNGMVNNRRHYETLMVDAYQTLELPKFHILISKVIPQASWYYMIDFDWGDEMEDVLDLWKLD